MPPHGDRDRTTQEQALAEGMREVASELRLINVTDFISYIRFGQFGNISNLVASATELYFKPGTVRFVRSGEIDVEWDCLPSVKLDMEFHHKNVLAKFRLVLKDMYGGVEICSIAVSNCPDQQEPSMECLISAINEARFEPRTSMVLADVPSTRTAISRCTF